MSKGNEQITHPELGRCEVIREPGDEGPSKPLGWKHHQHFWDHCAECERWMVVCGKCGNNSCNGGYGELAGGVQCDVCAEAYAMQDSGEGEPHSTTKLAILAGYD